MVAFEYLPEFDRFVSSRPANPGISEEEIMDEVRAVRYAK